MNIGHNSKAVSIEGLPVSMQEIAEALGASIVFSLVEHFGGTEIKVPYALKDGHRLEAIGRDQAEMLCHMFPEKKLHVPITLDRTKLKRQIDELEARGWKRWQIARELHITQRHVRRLANRRPPDEGQLPLFEGLDD